MMIKQRLRAGQATTHVNMNDFERNNSLVSQVFSTIKGLWWYPPIIAISLILAKFFQLILITILL